MKPRNDLVVEDAGGELVVLDKDGGKVHQLNESAALIWRDLDAGLKMEEIVSNLCKTFDVEQQMATSDVQNTISQFVELGLFDE